MKISKILSVASLLALSFIFSIESNAVCTDACKKAVFDSETYKSLIENYKKSTNQDPTAEFYFWFAGHFAVLQRSVCAGCTPEEIKAGIVLPPR